MKIALYAAGAAALALTAAPATAQEMQAQAPAEAKPVSDAELETFIVAASQMQQVNANTQIAQADKQQAMVQILSQAGMTPQRFNRIATALETSEQLQARADQALARLRAQAQG